MTNTLKVEGYEIVQYVLDSETRAILNEVPGATEVVTAADALLYSTSISSVPVETKHVKPNTLFSLPESERGETVVTYAGARPQLDCECDEFGNLQMVIGKGSVVTVFFKSKKFPEGKLKVYSTL